METHRFWRTPALPFVESRWARDSVACYAPHTHNMLSLGAVDGGHSIFSRERVATRLKPGDVVLIPAGQVHACNPEGDASWCYQMLYLDESWLSELVGEIAGIDSCVVSCLPRGTTPRCVHAALSKLTRCLLSGAEDLSKEAALVQFAIEVFLPLRASLPAAPRGVSLARLEEVKHLISARCTERLTLTELASHAGMTRYHFIRAFRKVVGMTPHAWQIDARINRARRAIDEGMPLSELALLMGFADQSHFQRAFKQRVAATPKQYRRNFLQD